MMAEATFVGESPLPSPRRSRRSPRDGKKVRPWVAAAAVVRATDHRSRVSSMPTRRPRPSRQAASGELSVGDDERSEESGSSSTQRRTRQRQRYLEVTTPLPGESAAIRPLDLRPLRDRSRRSSRSMPSSPTGGARLAAPIRPRPGASSLSPPLSTRQCSDGDEKSQDSQKSADPPRHGHSLWARASYKSSRAEKATRRWQQRVRAAAAYSTACEGDENQDESTTAESGSTVSTMTTDTLSSVRSISSRSSGPSSPTSTGKRDAALPQRSLSGGSPPRPGLAVIPAVPAHPVVSVRLRKSSSVSSSIGGGAHCHSSVGASWSDELQAARHELEAAAVANGAPPTPVKAEYRSAADPRAPTPPPRGPRSYYDEVWESVVCDPGAAGGHGGFAALQYRCDMGEDGGARYLEGFRLEYVPASSQHAFSLAARARHHASRGRDTLLLTNEPERLFAYLERLAAGAAGRDVWPALPRRFYDVKAYAAKALDCDRSRIEAAHDPHLSTNRGTRKYEVGLDTLIERARSQGRFFCNVHAIMHGNEPPFL